MQAHGQSSRSKRVPGLGAVRHLLIFLAFPFFLFVLPGHLCGCHAWKAYKSMKDVREEVASEASLERQPPSLYHLEVAEGLLNAAEKQYEDADFSSATDFAGRAADHLERSRQLRAFHERVIEDSAGGAQ